jgi:hypothetical protein
MYCKYSSQLLLIAPHVTKVAAQLAAAGMAVASNKSCVKDRSGENA